MSTPTVPHPIDQVPPGWVKVCRSCGQLKSYDAFHTCHTTVDGCRHMCKSCRNERDKRTRHASLRAAGRPVHDRPGRPRRPPTAARPPIPWTTAIVAPAQLFRCAALHQLIRAAA